MNNVFMRLYTVLTVSIHCVVSLTLLKNIHLSGDPSVCKYALGAWVNTQSNSVKSTKIVNCGNKADSQELDDSTWMFLFIYSPISTTVVSL